MGPASGTGRAHRLSIRSTSEIRHWFKQLSHPHLLRSTAPLHILTARLSKHPRAHQFGNRPSASISFQVRELIGQLSNARTDESSSARAVRHAHDISSVSTAAGQSEAHVKPPPSPAPPPLSPPTT